MGIMETNMPNVTTETPTPYGIIFRSGDREWFTGSEQEYRTAKAWAYYTRKAAELRGE